MVGSLIICSPRGAPDLHGVLSFLVIIYMYVDTQESAWHN